MLLKIEKIKVEETQCLNKQSKYLWGNTMKKGKDLWSTKKNKRKQKDDIRCLWYCLFEHLNIKNAKITKIWLRIFNFTWWSMSN